MLEQRVSMNEESVSGVMDYFKECRESKSHAGKQVIQYNPQAIMQELAEERAKAIRIAQQLNKD